jgi:hypothetical protein
MTETKNLHEGFDEESFAKGMACGLYLIYSTMQQFKFAYTSAEEWINVVSSMPPTLGNDVQYYFEELNRSEI